MLELIAGIAVALAALALILEPLVRPPGPAAAVAEAELDEDDLLPAEESDSPKVQALLALKEIEFDRATGKLSDEDYEQLKAKYAAQAVQAIKADQGEPAAGAALADEAEALIERMKAGGVRSCPVHGPRPEEDALFCSECGRALARQDDAVAPPDEMEIAAGA